MPLMPEDSVFRSDLPWGWCEARGGAARIFAGEYADEGEPDLLVDVYGSEAAAVARWICEQHNGRPTPAWVRCALPPRGARGSKGNRGKS
jgi:hypothetical protein